MIVVPGICSAFFMVVWKQEYVYVHEFYQEHLRAQSGAFTSSVKSVHEFCQEHSRGSPFTNPDGGIWNNHLICFTPLHSNVSSGIRVVSNTVSKNILFETYLSKSNTTRILVRNTNVYEVHEVHRLRAQTGAFTSFNIHLERSRGSRVSTSIWNVHELRQEHMERLRVSYGTYETSI